MLGDDLMQHGVLGVARAIRGRATCHAFWGSAPAPPCLCRKMDTRAQAGTGSLMCLSSRRSCACGSSGGRRAGLGA